jgi:hypothetical protein
MNHRRFLVAAAACAVGLQVCSAAFAALRVDLSPDNGRKDVLTPGIENWTLKDAPSASQTFADGIAVTLRAGSGALTTPWFKGGYDTGATIASDGVCAKGKLELVISGLSAGKHSIVTWHSSVEDKPAGPYTILVDGKEKLTGVTPSRRVATDADATAAFVEVNATAGKDVVVAISGDGDVILNGFAIDVPDPNKQAIKPTPEAGNEHATQNPVLSWTPAKSAKSHNVYFGTSAQAVKIATPASPEFKGTQTQPKFATKDLNTFDTYYWRVDEVNGADESQTPPTTGDVWSFRVAHVAFPGAEGYGRFAIGGRGGRVIEVTNLDDSGPGSLREAVEAQGPRTVIFRVGGNIQLKDKLVIHNPYITIAGQTAPGDGIAICGATFGNLSTHDTIIRYVRVRVGDESGKTYDGMGFAGSDNCIIDHCSIAWTIDESVSSRGGKNITFQRNIIAEPLNMSVHSHYVGTGKGHSFAGSISGDIGSFHHNLLANAAGRNWSLAGGLTRGGKMAGYLDIRNNVVYNWQHRTNDGGVKALNLVANYYIPGPASRVFHLLMPDTGQAGDPQQYFVADNMMEGHPQYDADNWKNGGVIFSDKLDPRTMPQVKLDKPFCEPYVTTQSAKEAYASVIADVGANYPKYDAIDARTVKDVINRSFTYKGSKTNTPGIIDSQNDVGGFPQLKGGEAPADSDHDGMPDSWEKSNGLNPNDPSDGAKDSVSEGYTNLERYLNGIVASNTRAG